MNKFVRAAQTSHSLSLAAMEEASRLGLREADIEHLFLALVISDQAAGRALRELGIDIDTARRVVKEQHDDQLTALGIEASFPTAGRITFHETTGYEWTPRARDLIAKSSGKGKAGDAGAVLRELLADPSGLISEIIARLGTTTYAISAHLDQSESPAEDTTSAAKNMKGWSSGSIEVFVPAPIAQVWDLLADPARIPDWEPSIGVVKRTDQNPRLHANWEGIAPTSYPDGKPAKIKSQYRRRSIELVAADQPDRIVWKLGFPDIARSNPVLTEFMLATTTGGTQVQISRSWARRQGWRGLVIWPLRPLQKFLLWIGLSQMGSAISRSFR